MAIAVPLSITETTENVCIQNVKQDCYIYTKFISPNYNEELKQNAAHWSFILFCHKIDSNGRYIIFYQQDLMKQTYWELLPCSCKPTVDL